MDGIFEIQIIFYLFFVLFSLNGIVWRERRNYIYGFFYLLRIDVVDFSATQEWRKKVKDEWMANEKPATTTLAATAANQLTGAENV